jgi:hypothetical protein
LKANAFLNLSRFKKKKQKKVYQLFCLLFNSFIKIDTKKSSRVSQILADYQTSRARAPTAKREKPKCCGKLFEF